MTAAVLPQVAASETVTPAVRVHELSKAFGSGARPVLALDRVSFNVRRGEFVCLVGASGCGKSTLLSVIAGLARPSGGAVEVDEQRVSLLFQEPALLPWLTVGGNISLALRLAGIARSERPAKVRELLELVHLAGLESRRPHELSGGMRQRVALARALAQRSRVLLMDEPFGALDAITRDLLHEQLERIWSTQGLTILFVTHNVREAARLGDRILLMRSRPGRVTAEFPVDIARPRTIESPEVASLAAKVTERLRSEVRRHAG